MARRAGLLAVILLLLTTSSASAATATVKMVNYGFNPQNQTVNQGDSVRWQNVSSRKHTATPNVFWAWTSVTVRPGATSSAVTFTQAGSFPYHCAIHPLRMKGRITVPMTVNPLVGTTTTFFALKVGTVQAPGVLVHDVYVRRNGGAWVLRATSASPTIWILLPSPGTWDVHTRLRYLLKGTTSGWSPIVTLQVS